MRQPVRVGLLRPLASIGLLALACGCSATNGNPTGAPAFSTATPVMSWRLHRASIGVEAGFELTSCDRGPTFEVAITLLERPGADRALLVAVDSGNLASGWLTERNISATMHDNGTLRSIGADVTDRTAEVIGNVVRGAIGLASIAVAGPAGAGLLSGSRREAGCTAEALGYLRSVAALRAEAAGGNLTARRRGQIASAMATLRDRLTLRLNATINPEPQHFGTGTSASYSFALEEAELLKLLTITGSQRILGPLAANPIPVGERQVNRDFVVAVTVEAAQRPVAVPALAGPISRPVYRDAVPALVVAQLNDGKGTARTGTNVHLAQLGAMREIPLDASIFQSNGWKLSFAANGRVTEFALRSSARAVTATGAAAGVAESLAGFLEDRAEARAAARTEAESAELRRVQAERDLLQAQISVIKARQELEALRGGTETP